MEHWCRTCVHTEFNNQMGMECPWCGKPMKSFWDEEPPQEDDFELPVTEEENEELH